MWSKRHIDFRRAFPLEELWRAMPTPRAVFWIGDHETTKSKMTVLPDDRNQLSFSIFRLLLAVAVFGVGFVFFKPLGTASILIGLFVSLAIAGIVLLARKRHLGLILRSLIWSAFGMMVGMYFCPLGYPSRHSNYHSGDEFRYMIFGAIAGWLFGIGVTHRHSITSSMVENQ